LSKSGQKKMNLTELIQALKSALTTKNWQYINQLQESLLELGDSESLAEIPVLIKTAQSKLNQLKEATILLDGYIAKIEENKNFIWTDTEIRAREVDLSPGRFELYEVQVTKTFDIKQREYEEGIQGKIKVENIIDCLNKELKEVFEQILHYLSGEKTMNREELLKSLESALTAQDWQYVQQLQGVLISLGDTESLTQMESILKKAKDLQYQEIQSKTISEKKTVDNFSETNMKPKQNQNKKEINILILGETGVGKSTWVNAFANYVMYGNLQEAEREEIICLIPSSFTMTDDNYQEKLITIGQDNNESFVKGQSATQYPRAYILEGEYKIRLIDTPGIGDTRGIEQDKKNVANILAFLSNFDEIHGICILLKPNNARLNVMFQFCIKELLTHLHRSAAKNIIFCFTNARGTFYKPGDTLPALKKLLEDNPDVEITLSKQTIYCMDNESFRFLAALKNGVLFDEKDRQDYSASWDRSVKETARLLEYVVSLQPHKTQDTLTLNDARRLVVNLSRPIAEISQNIQTNIAVLEDKKKEVTSSKQSVQTLLKNLYIPKIDIEQKILDYPRTVCTSSKCVEVISDEDGIKKIHYKTHCHAHCSLDGVQTDVVNNVALQNCSAMNSSNYCKVCGCSWTTHMHITYETYPVQKKIIDKSIKTQIESKEEGQREIEKFIQKLDERVEELKKEQQLITQASAKFACFLKQNAIAPYNDALAAYLDHLIHEEEQKVGIGGGNQALKGLQQMKREYDEQIKILDDAMKRGEHQARITPDDIRELEQQLLNLKITGADLKTVITNATAGKSSAVTYNERQVQTRNYRRSDGLISDFTNAVAGAANTLLDFINPQNKQ